MSLFKLLYCPSRLSISLFNPSISSPALTSSLDRSSICPFISSTCPSSLSTLLPTSNSSCLSSPNPFSSVVNSSLKFSSLFFDEDALADASISFSLLLLYSVSTLFKVLPSFFSSTLRSLIPSSLISPLYFLYLSALFACLFNEFICLSSSPAISPILSKFCWDDSSFCIAAFLLCLYFMTPAASSIINLLSSGFEFIILFICPCSIIENPLVFRPVSRNTSTISFSLHGVLFI